MIQVVEQPEYPGFNAEVRVPGAAFLANNPNPTSDQFKKKNFWQKASKELHAAYSGVCAYTAIYLPDQGSVDHFFPKTTHPQLAYEWSNYRLASGRVNSRKGNQANILDPFEVQNDWFFLDIPACLLRANPNLPKPLRTRISGTINSLGLNDENYADERCNILVLFAGAHVSCDFLQQRYPFLAKELTRQQLSQDALRALFKI
jgi:hypothetical protein